MWLHHMIQCESRQAQTVQPAQVKQKLKIVSTLSLKHHYLKTAHKTANNYRYRYSSVSQCAESNKDQTLDHTLIISLRLIHEHPGSQTGNPAKSLMVKRDSIIHKQTTEVQRTNMADDSL